MRLFLAGVYTSNFTIGGRAYARLSDVERRIRDGIQNFLESYHYIHRQKYVDNLRNNKKRVFLDSGAFSAHTKGVNIDIQGYCDYIKKNHDIILVEDGQPVASVLDGIGDPLKTWQNQQTMESLGVRPLPCFHYGEDERYLEWYIERYPYITLGGMVMVSEPQLKVWLDHIWDKYLVKTDGTPKVKVHGFGLTILRLMKRYPWYSVDSSAWVQLAANGSIMIPGYGTVFVSSSSPTAKIAGRHIDSIPPLQREALVKRIEVEGFTVPRLQTEYITRWLYNCWAYERLGEMYTKEVHAFHPDQERLFE